MIYKSNLFDIERARVYFEKLIASNKPFELRKLPEPKSNDQNSYVHLIMSWYALELGYSNEYMKQVIVKEVICPDIFLIERTSHKTGEVYTDKLSFAELTKEQLTAVITKIRNHASIESGVYLPDSTDLAAMSFMAIEIKKNEQYL